ncbi:tubulin-tyrosine ligase family protein (macronuclear) [Tetrahymena thermophila SB210]|uniref:Tubulin-tyrosine ligase family protein n=1 Tax=Tetrahymena thermophila (strain SB210) TaxID=312017 RepID=I7M3M8_TETTS|nr:tubulin-tyrosine ligase family protein [Tetrahymena thermophila SB210]EAS03760.2 tubulin-tyrosine ligase family protein [Tetrahymena thermophila SB210]|eukprot:XP_001024005.2 tubulin-tyrosine ligase family protein [Tetrahymena thermophila SB210]
MYTPSSSALKLKPYTQISTVQSNDYLKTQNERSKHNLYFNIQENKQDDYTDESQFQSNVEVLFKYHKNKENLARLRLQTSNDVRMKKANKSREKINNNKDEQAELEETKYLKYSKKEFRIKSRNNQIKPLLIKDQQNKMNSLLLLRQPSTKAQFTYVVEPGNNSELIKKILMKRSWITEMKQNSTSWNFKWKPTSSGLHYDELTKIGTKKQSTNHIQFHSEISSKAKLFTNLTYYAKTVDEQAQFIIPSSFLLNLDSESLTDELDEFFDLFLTVQNSTALENIWLLKPTDTNRGRGIKLFNKLEQFMTYMQGYGKNGLIREKLIKLGVINENDIIQNYKQSQVYEQYNTKNLQNKSKKIAGGKQLIIQKYLENPLLITNRKFDMRIWVLIDQDLQYYVFKEGYIRLSSEIYNLDSQNLNNIFIHLTNNAVQKTSQNYGKYENGNIISYKQMKDILSEQKPNISFDQILNQIKQCIMYSMTAAEKKLTKRVNNNTFEIFGYDFMVDQQGEVSLIEINSNPCLEESNQLLSTLIPRMLNDAFRLTIDKIFSASTSYSESISNKSKSLFYISSIDYPVEGYNSYENLWELIGQLI